MKHAAGLIVALVCALASVGPSAWAAGGEPAHPVAQACQQDVKTLCPGVEPGEGRIKACLRKNRSQVSDGCKAALKQAHAEHKREHKAGSK